MLEQRKEKVTTTYQRLKKSGKLSANLLHPTTANLRNECVIVFSKCPDERIRSILKGFGVEISIAADIRNIDPDKFRPLRKFILEEIENPNIQTVELLAWLLKFYDAEIQPITNPIKTPIYKQKYFQIVAVLLLLIAIYVVWPRPKCMYWDGSAYQQKDCNQAAEEELKAVRLDDSKLKRFKRITRPDTINYKDIGRVWYMKIDTVPDFFTDSGMHPVDEEKQLKPITKYIIDKYILKKKDTTVVGG
ncbi:hypothetical protein [Pedobacter sp. SL55]|uniref:hypothetical protein n=1 Tax=Pedobacter sp. SL55 TaxID=2995161 RepID=UPI00227051C3|nr:hypothetical protein [Pedobacter sp. SL55]WAC39361.1 hypothetical protein OVA16_12170 [Pedobacter sp. SL55]